jgi:hypothetical protein
VDRRLAIIATIAVAALILGTGFTIQSLTPTQITTQSTQSTRSGLVTTGVSSVSAHGAQHLGGSPIDVSDAQFVIWPSSQNASESGALEMTLTNVGASPVEDPIIMFQGDYAYFPGVILIPGQRFESRIPVNSNNASVGIGQSFLLRVEGSIRGEQYNENLTISSVQGNDSASITALASLDSKSLNSTISIQGNVPVMLASACVSDNSTTPRGEDCTYPSTVYSEGVYISTNGRGLWPGQNMSVTFYNLSEAPSLSAGATYPVLLTLVFMDGNTRQFQIMAVSK